MLSLAKDVTQKYYQKRLVWKRIPKFPQKTCDRAFAKLHILQGQFFVNYFLFKRYIFLDFTLSLSHFQNLIATKKILFG